MEQSRNVFIPQTITWLLRVASHERLSEVFLADPLVFAGWYAQIGDLLNWPAEVQTIQRREREQKLPLDRALKLLSQVDYAYAGRTSVSHARRVLEGNAIHDEWAKRNIGAFTQLVRAKAETMASVSSPEMLALSAGNGSHFCARLNEFSKTLGLSELEQDILAFAFLTTLSDEIAGLFRKLAADRWVGDRLWTTVFNASKETLSKALRPQSPLRLCGILLPSDRSTQLVRVSHFWVDLLDDADALFDAVLEPYDKKASSGMPARLLEEDQALATAILKNTEEPGVNLLLYGAGSLEKRRLVKQLSKDSSRQAWKVRKFEEAGRDAGSCLAYLAFQLLKGHPERSVLVVDKPGSVLQSVPSSFMRQLFGIELEVDDTPDFDEHLLKTNPIPGLWLASDAAVLPESTVAQFVFHAPLKKADKATRVAALEEHLDGIDLSGEARADILKLEGVSSAQLESALKAARLSGICEDTGRDHAIVQAVRRSQRALSRDMQPKTKESVTTYSLKYLNTAGRIRPEQLVECFKRNPKGTLLLYGIPGTGKTQFVDHLAQELGMPLMTRSASELMSKWLGESEKNIAQAFEDAANEEAVLFLDEGDSFLRDRGFAKNSWEVTQVNELLQRMERFPGICVVATNLFEGLDVAAMRRFTFKLQFLALEADQRWEMFLNETGLKSEEASLDARIRDDWQMRLTLMLDLAPGDFATVKRQSNILHTIFTPEAWLDQLEIECRAKRHEREGKQLA